jgi:hypothetical protein
MRSSSPCASLKRVDSETFREKKERCWACSLLPGGDVGGDRRDFAGDKRAADLAGDKRAADLAILVSSARTEGLRGCALERGRGIGALTPVEE